MFVIRSFIYNNISASVILKETDKTLKILKFCGFSLCVHETGVIEYLVHHLSVFKYLIVEVFLMEYVMVVTFCFMNCFSFYVK